VPYAALHQCTAPGCSELAPRGHAQCPTHRATERRRYSATPTQQARRRTYNTQRWRRFARRYLIDHGWCTVEGCTQLATDVDHIQPLGEWRGSAYDRGNLQALCKFHHSQKTAAEVFRRT
jgi:5-methylcytosine-specific restriction protein A